MFFILLLVAVVVFFALVIQDVEATFGAFFAMVVIAFFGNLMVDGTPHVSTVPLTRMDNAYVFKKDGEVFFKTGDKLVDTHERRVEILPGSPAEARVTSYEASFWTLIPGRDRYVLVVPENGVEVVK